MNPIDWINGIISDATSGIANLASSVAQKIAWLYNFVVGFFQAVRWTVIRIRDFVRNYLIAALTLAQVVYGTLKWLAQTALPRAISQLFDILKAYIERLVAQTLAAARALVDVAQRFVMGILNALKARVEAIFTWTIDRITDLYHKVNALLDHVFGVLATADRLVQWILAALVKALMRWALDNALSIGRAFWAARTRILLDGANLIEDIISRII